MPILEKKKNSVTNGNLGWGSISSSRAGKTTGRAIAGVSKVEGCGTGLPFQKVTYL